jgi:uncharacterized membrane protein
VQWDAETTASIPDQLIAWSTTPGSQVEHAGLVRFQPADRGTRIQVELDYNPPGAALGHLVACLFGADPLGAHCGAPGLLEQSAEPVPGGIRHT